MEKKKPQIRFNGFEGEWVTTTLGDIAVRVVSKNDDNGVILPLTISAQYGLISQTEFFNSRIAAKDVRGYYVIKKGEFAYNRSTSEFSPFGAVKRLDRYDAGVLSTLYIVFRLSSEQIQSNYLVNYFSTSNWHQYIAENAAEGARNHGLLNITAEDFLKTPIKAPIVPEEQKKIASFLTTLDKLIAKLEAKLDKLRKLKQALLEKMFINVNGGGYEAPQIRFKGYTDKWQVKELREVAEFAKGKGYSKGDLTKEGIPIIRYGSLYTDYRTEIDSVSEYVQYSEGAIFSRGGEVIIPASGETSEDIARASAVKLPNVILGGDLNIIYPNAEINAVFLATEITYGKSHTYLAMKAQGASVVHLRKLDISSLSPKFPSISEQQQIGKYFVQMDVQLSKASIKLTKLRNIKQSLLQKMFA